MSVLNTMLRDLERRGERLPLSLTPQVMPQQETKAQAAAAPLHAPAFEAAKRRKAVRPAVLLAGVAGAAAATWLWLHPASPAGLRRASPAKPPSEAPLPSAATASAVASGAKEGSAQAPSQAAPTVAPEATSATPQAEPLASPAPAQSAAPAAPEAAPQSAPVQPEHPHTPTPAFAPGSLRVPGASAGKPATPPATPTAKPETNAAAEAPSSPPTPAAVQSVAPSELARAMQLITRGRNTEAAEVLMAALAQRPAWNEARSTLAALQAEAGDRPHALTTLLDGVPFEPRRFAPMAAQLQAELNDPSGALQTLDRVPADARDQTYHGLAAAIAQRAGRHDFAVAEYGAALRFAPANSVAWLGMGVSLQALGRDAEALAAYRSAAAGTLSADLRSFAQARISALQVSVAAAPAGR